MNQTVCADIFSTITREALSCYRCYMITIFTFQVFVYSIRVSHTYNFVCFFLPAGFAANIFAILYCANFNLSVIAQNLVLSRINLIFRWLHPQMMIITTYCWQFLEFPPHHVEGGGNLGSNLEPNWIVWSAHEWGDWSVRTKVKHSQHQHHFHQQPHFGISGIANRTTVKFSLSS